MNTKILEALAVTCAVTNTEMPEAAVRVMTSDLGAYPEEAVLTALVRCRRELTGRLTLAAVIERIDDGRPGPEEAWAASPRAESESAVWTPEWATAYFAALPHVQNDDMVAARMAFLERYRRGLTEARTSGKPPRWSLSMGHDRRGRDEAVMNAVRLGRIGQGEAMAMLPHLTRDDFIALPDPSRGPKRLSSPMPGMEGVV